MQGFQGTVIFNDECFLQSNIMQKMLLGKFKASLYHFEESTIKAQSHLVNDAAVTSGDTNKINLWHLRMGHMPISMLHHLDLDFLKSSSMDHVCQICLAAKQVRNSFLSSSIKTTTTLELLHVDI